jgi:hypothetical protein
MSRSPSCSWFVPPPFAMPRARHGSATIKGPPLHPMPVVPGLALCGLMAHLATGPAQDPVSPPGPAPIPSPGPSPIPGNVPIEPAPLPAGEPPLEVPPMELPPGTTPPAMPPPHMRDRGRGTFEGATVRSLSLGTGKSGP